MQLGTRALSIVIFARLYGWRGALLRAILRTVGFLGPSRLEPQTTHPRVGHDHKTSGRYFHPALGRWGHPSCRFPEIFGRLRPTVQHGVPEHGPRVVVHRRVDRDAATGRSSFSCCAQKTIKAFVTVRSRRSGLISSALLIPSANCSPVMLRHTFRWRVSRSRRRAHRT